MSGGVNKPRSVFPSAWSISEQTLKGQLTSSTYVFVVRKYLPSLISLKLERLGYHHLLVPPNFLSETMRFPQWFVVIFRETSSFVLEVHHVTRTARLNQYSSVVESPMRGCGRRHMCVKRRADSRHSALIFRAPLESHPYWLGWHTWYMMWSYQEVSFDWPKVVQQDKKWCEVMGITGCGDTLQKAHRILVALYLLNQHSHYATSVFCRSYIERFGTGEWAA